MLGCQLCCLVFQLHVLVRLSEEHAILEQLQELQQDGVGDCQFASLGAELGLFGEGL